MARKQTRRSVSINRLNYEAAQRAATTRGMTVAGLVEFALGAIGIPVVAHLQQPSELVNAMIARKGKSLTKRRQSVSLNRRNYEAVKQEAASRGIAIARLVEIALGSIGVPVVATSQSLVELERIRGDRGKDRSTALHEAERSDVAT